VVLAFLLTEWLLLSGAGSFTRALGVGGVLGSSVVSGLFPVLLLVACRRKGDRVPDVVIGALGHPLVVTTIYLLFLAVLFAHGLFIWDSPVERVAALAVGLLVVAGTVAMARQGAFARRLVVELREELPRSGPPRALFAVTDGGRAAPSEVGLDCRDGQQHRALSSGEWAGLDGLRAVTYRLAPSPARELKVWAHRVNPGGDSDPIPALVDVESDDGQVRRVALTSARGQALLPLSGRAGRVTITLPEPPCP
jgi:hypothetical protein